MEWTMKNGAIATGALTLAVVAGTATWQLMGRSESAVAGQTLRLETPAEADQRLAAHVDNEQLRRQNAELQQRLEAMAAQLARTPAVAPPPPPIVAEARPEQPPPEAPAAPVFDDPAYAEAMRAIDWKTIGEVTVEMAPKLIELLQALDKEGAEMPAELAILISKLNQKLLDQVPALLGAKLPGFGANGVYTHPLVVANSLAATLASAGQALSPAQQGALAALTRTFGSENAAIAGQQHEFDLEALAAETEMKDRMYEQFAQTLTAEQREVMFPPGAQTYDGGSLFSTGLLWSLHGEGVPAANPADFARVASRKLEAQLGLDEASGATVRRLLERAAAGAPELFTERASTLETNTGRMLKSGRAKQALQRQLAWMREIQRTVPLTAEQQKKLANWRRVLVPLPR
jgi:hypothetical protein